MAAHAVSAPTIARKGTDRTVPHALRLLVPIGRVLFAAIFLLSAPAHFTTGAIGYAASHGVPLAGVAVPVSGLLALAGGLSVLFGYKTRWGAAALAIFLVPVTLLMHNFWARHDASRMVQQAMFMKNLSMLGASFLLMYFGGGPFSIDARSRRTTHPRALVPLEHPASPREVVEIDSQLPKPL